MKRMNRLQVLLSSGLVSSVFCRLYYIVGKAFFSFKKRKLIWKYFLSKTALRNSILRHERRLCARHTPVAASLPTGLIPSQITKQFNKGSVLRKAIRFLSCSCHSAVVRAAANYSRAWTADTQTCTYITNTAFEKHITPLWPLPHSPTAHGRFVRVSLNGFYIGWNRRHLEIDSKVSALKFQVENTRLKTVVMQQA